MVRRDNIGDLVCTTPLFAALRARFPAGWIGALVNSYNAPVLAGNPDVDEVFAYEKMKHRQGGVIANLWSRYRVLAALRRRALDYAVLAGDSGRSLALARAVNPRKIVGFGSRGAGLDIAFSRVEGRHEVESTFVLAQAFGIQGPPPASRVAADEQALARWKSAVTQHGLDGRRLVGVHISARKASQRWPVANFVALLEELSRDERLAFLLFWAPGPRGHPRHPGDDEKAAALMGALAGRPVLPVPSASLADLIAGLALCERVICSDGGAMHIAASLGKPLVCLFGRSDAARWRPWEVRHELLQPATREVKDLSVAEVREAYRRLDRQAGIRGPTGPDLS